jgi:hypothetical protein
VARADEILEKCDQSHCDEKRRKIHYDQYVKRHWDPHPPAEFISWWSPFDIDQESGASVGGHPDAIRVHARKEPGRWTRKIYGVPLRVAWNTACYVNEFEAWKSAGSPEPVKETICIQSTIEEQLGFWRGLKSIVDRIGRKMPKIDPGLLALEDKKPREMPDP